MKSQKNKFNLQKDVSYINCAYMSPLLKSTEEIGITGIQKKRNPFKVKQEDFFKDNIPLKANFAQLVNCKAHNVALFPAVSYGFASILNSFEAPSKKHCILVENEFPSGYFAAEKWAKKNDKKLKIIRSEEGDHRIANWNEKLLSTINEKTAFVLISSVHWMDGSKFDLEQIGKKCRKVGAKLFVDGTQSVGALPMDIKKFKIDLLVCATYKWLFGPYSNALGYISDDLISNEPLEESWLNRSNAEDFSKLANYESSYFSHAWKFNAGQNNDFIKSPMLTDALSQVLKWKAEEIQLYCKKLISPLLTTLQELEIKTEDDCFQASHLLGFRFGNKIKPEKLAKECQKNKIILSSRGDFLRISPNVYNNEADIQKLINAIKKSI
jgi:selenocysteine lyase/cysteine desulfurase